MIWKPKEKELTAEEAVALAVKELAPYWFGSIPRLAGVKTSGGHIALPLDPEFNKRPWLIFFVDPTDFSGESALVYAREWFNRYNSLHLEVLTIFYQTYRFFENPAPIRALLERFEVEFPLVMDYDGSFASAFGATVLPMLLLLDEGKYVFRHMGKDWKTGTELAIQNFLRSDDPGLALLNVFDPEKEDSEGMVMKMAIDTSRIEFGFQPKIGDPTLFPSPGFQVSHLAEAPVAGAAASAVKKSEKWQARGEIAGDNPKVKTGNFADVRPEKLGLGQVFLTGEWIQEVDRICTSDPQATLIFRSTGGRVSLISQSMSPVGEVALIYCELGGGAAYDAVVGQNLILDETGESLVKVNKPLLYHLFVNLPEELREITLRFPNAEKIGVGIYGVRFGD